MYVRQLRGLVAGSGLQMHQPLTSCIPIYIAASPIHTPVPCVAWCCLVWAQVVLASLVRTLAGLRASSSSLVDALVGSKRDRRSSIPLSRGIAESLNKVRVVCNVWLRVGVSGGGGRGGLG